MIEITVLGTPRPKGSKSFKGTVNGHAIMAESCKGLVPWLGAVKWAALEHRTRLAGPVRVEMIFTMPKPKSAPKRRVTWPDRKPDIDKLCRAVLDALVAVGTIEDDARVILLRAGKVFPAQRLNTLADGDGVLDVPGVVIRLAEVRE